MAPRHFVNVLFRQTAKNYHELSPNSECEIALLGEAIMFGLLTGQFISLFVLDAYTLKRHVIA